MNPSQRSKSRLYATVALAAILMPALLLSLSNAAILQPLMAESESAASPINIGQPFILGVNQTASMQFAGIDVKFVNVTEDSRCPSDVTCIWEGQVSVLVDLTNSSNGKDLGSITLTLRGSGGHDGMSAKTIGRYSLELLDVQPYPTSTHKISQSEYSAKFVLLLKDQGQSSSHGVFVKAVNENHQNSNSTVTAIVSGWNVEKRTGAIVIFMQDKTSDTDSIFKRMILKFSPSNSNNCSNSQAAECIDGQIIQIDRNKSSGSVHIEIDNTRATISLTYNISNANSVAGQALSITRFETWSKPVGGNGSAIVLQEGQRDGPLLVQKIYSDRIEGLNYLEYPIAREEGNPITLHIGEKASNGCTVTLTLVKIDAGKGATFVKTVDQNRPCPICWFQQALLSS